MFQDQDTKEALISPTQLKLIKDGEMPFKTVKSVPQ